ncbi:squalene synthetase-like protein [Coemansia sp. IMI 203386]|nr:squalene synthetase-like protein [Coemansia sp. IMI 203386]
MDDDLFVIDTKGATNFKVATATANHHIRVVGPSAGHSNGERKGKQKNKQFRTITDDIAVTSAHASSSGGSPMHKRNGMKGLNEQFLGLDVGTAKGKGKGKQRNRRKKNWEANKKKEASHGHAYGGPPKGNISSSGFENDDYADEALDDYIDNLDEKELALLLEGSVGDFNGNGNGYGYATRDIGGNNGDPDAMLADQNEVEDPYEYDDEMAQMLLDASATGFDNSDSDEEDDEDGIPVDLDMESLPGPGKYPVPKSKKKGRVHTQGGQNIKDFKALDREKSKNSHAKQKNRNKDNVEGPSAGFDPRTVIRRLDMLTQSDDLGSIWLQPMNKFERQIVHLLAREYNVKSKSHGNNDRRSPVLTLTSRSHRPDNRRRINRLLLLFDEGGLIPDHWTGPQGGGGRRDGVVLGGKGGQGPKGKRKGADSQKGPAQMHGKMVAHNAPVVGDSNVGHKMLKQMGWQPGQGLGANEEGRSTPVEVMFRAGRRGLGS